MEVPQIQTSAAIKSQERQAQKNARIGNRADLNRKPAKRLSVALLGRGQCFQHFLYSGGVLDVAATIYLQLILHGLGGGRREHPAQG